jgi:hypothetical protein
VDVGWFVYMTGPFLLSYYAVRCAGRQAALPLLAFLALTAIGYVMGAVVQGLLAAGE